MNDQQLQRQITLAYRIWQDVQTERLRAEGRLRSANLCKFCGGKKVPKKDHECPRCHGDQCSHCDGSGLDPVQIPQEALDDLGMGIGALKDAEDGSRKRLVKLYRQHPLRPVIADCSGVGEELGAQLIGMVGTFERFHNPAKLWAYLGLGVEEDGKRQRRHAGQQSNFKPEGQVWAFKVGEQFWHWGKNGYYGDVYRHRLTQEEVKAEKGAKRRAARYTVKMILKRIWCAANGAEER